MYFYFIDILNPLYIPLFYIKFDSLFANLAYFWQGWESISKSVNDIDIVKFRPVYVSLHSVSAPRGTIGCQVALCHASGWERNISNRKSSVMGSKEYHWVPQLMPVLFTVNIFVKDIVTLAYDLLQIIRNKSALCKWIIIYSLD